MIHHIHKTNNVSQEITALIVGCDASYTSRNYESHEEDQDKDTTISAKDPTQRGRPSLDKPPHSTTNRTTTNI